MTSTITPVRAFSLLALSAALAACGDSTPAATPANDAATASDVGSAADVADAGAAPLDAPAATDVPVVADDDVPIVTFHPDASSPHTAITATPDTWTWVPFPDSACGNGSPTGIGVNLHPGSTRVLIFLQGGGACWDGLTCYGVHTAANLTTGYGPAQFASEISAFQQFVILSRSNAQNPWHDANLVYVPYCTGDVHGGDRIIDYTFSGVHTTYHVGARNMDAFLARLALTFPHADRVTLSGISAGGFGAGIHWERVANAFPGVRVDLLDDSGPPIQPPGDRWATWRDNWNAQLPPGCATCRDHLDALLPYYAQHFPAPARFGLLSYTYDTTISTFFGQTPDEYRTQLLAATTRLIDPVTNARHFYVDDHGHVLLNATGSARGANGTVLLDWLNQMFGEAATLPANVNPPAS